MDREQHLDEVRTISPTGGEKGVKLERFDLIPPYPLYELAKLYGVGANKYAVRNWEKGIEFGKLFAAAQRHMWLWWSGEDVDEEMGVSHLTCATWHMFALVQLREEERLKNVRELDDRPRT